MVFLLTTKTLDIIWINKSNLLMIVCEDLISLISVFPDFVQIPLKSYSTNSKLMEIVFDIGKYPEARFTSGVVILAPRIICRQDMHYVLKELQLSMIKIVLG